MLRIKFLGKEHSSGRYGLLITTPDDPDNSGLYTLALGDTLVIDKDEWRIEEKDG